MIKSVTDTHRLMYRNATIRALDLSDRTTPVPFFNVTDQELPVNDIGYEVHTDAAGYLYSGANSRPIQCLAVNKSVIILQAIMLGILNGYYVLKIQTNMYV